MRDLEEEVAFLAWAASWTRYRSQETGGVFRLNKDDERLLRHARSEIQARMRLLARLLNAIEDAGIQAHFSDCVTAMLGMAYQIGRLTQDPPALHVWAKQAASANMARVKREHKRADEKEIVRRLVEADEGRHSGTALAKTANRQLAPIGKKTSPRSMRRRKQQARDQ